ncbi:DoxX family protein [Angustibacter luteus]|uniref:DoxX family protein n=1 Tax=Angustibacter luteus TaxID=658456 RepID=A0ABW1JAB8_9ACTN
MPSWGWKPLAALLATSGALHFARPRPFESIVPRQLGDPGPWVAVSGAAELACAAGLALPRTRRWAGLATAALFVGVFPANVQMAVTAQRSARASRGYRAGTLARLPLQAPLVAWALAIARTPRPDEPGR